jgi:predicted HD phosphohydrolase
MDVVSFTRMADGTAEEYAFLDQQLAPYAEQVRSEFPKYMAKLLHEQAGMTLGYRIDRYQHSLQTATRAFRDGADEETVVTALLHDVGDGIGLFNHSEFVAALLRPFVSERNHWIVRHHGLFQGYYYFHFNGGDRNARDRFGGNPHFQACVDFCENWDQCSFDPNYDTMPFEAFQPMIGRLFDRIPSNNFV